MSGGLSMADYVRKILPGSAEIDFIFKEDFDGDGLGEAVVGYTIWSEFPYEFTVVWVKKEAGRFSHKTLLTTVENPESLYDSNDEIYGLNESAFVADSDGDGRPELILGLTVGNGHFVTGYVFKWEKGKPKLVWQSPKSFAHGLLEVFDRDNDGVYDIVMEESTDYGNDIFSMSEASPHVRMRTIYQWEGKNYRGKNYKPGEESYQRYNVAAIFLRSIWKEDYRRAFGLVQLPVYLGIKGLDDSNFDAFVNFVKVIVRPKLMENLNRGSLRPREDNWFTGSVHEIYFSFAKDHGNIRISDMNFKPVKE